MVYVWEIDKSCARPMSAYFIISILNELIESIAPQKDLEICRICRDGHTSDMKLFKTPCNCTGSIGFVHVECQRMWQRIFRKNVCEICTKLIQMPSEYSTFKLTKIRLRKLFQQKYFGKTVWRMTCIVFTVATFIELAEILIMLLVTMHAMRLNAVTVGWFLTFLLQIDFLLSLNLIWIFDCLKKITRTLNDWWLDTDEENNASYSPIASSGSSLFDDIFAIL